MATGTRTSYTDTTPVKQTISDLIDMIDWVEAPLLRLLGVNNENNHQLVNWPNTTFSWLDDTMSPRAGTLGAQLLAGGTSATLQSGEAAYLKKGDVIRIGTENIYVGATNGDATISALERGLGSTTAAQHEDNDPWELVTVARLEGESYSTGHTTTVSSKTNYTQILAESVKVSGSEAVVPKYGINDTMAYHIAKLINDGGKAGKLAIMLQKIFYYGDADAGSVATQPRAAGGYEEYVTTRVTDLSGDALTRKHIEDEVEANMLAGGSPDCLVMNSWLRRKISTFYEGSIRTERTEETGGSTIKRIEADFGPPLEVVFDRWCPTDRLYVLEKKNVGWLTYRPFQVIDRAPDGDYTVKEVLGEYSFICRNENGMSYIKNASTTD